MTKLQLFVAARVFASQRTGLEEFGWDVRVLDGLDRTRAMQAAQVVPVLRPWLTSKVAAGRPE